MPFVRPATNIGDDVPVAVILPGLDVIVYPVISEPPLIKGAVKETDAEATPAVVNNVVGAPGTVMGVSSAEGADAAEMPAAFVATTVKV